MQKSSRELITEEGRVTLHSTRVWIDAHQLRRKFAEINVDGYVVEFAATHSLYPTDDRFLTLN